MLVLNATYEPINVCTVRRATVLLLKQKAEVIELEQAMDEAKKSGASDEAISKIKHVRDEMAAALDL